MGHLTVRTTVASYYLFAPCGRGPCEAADSLCRQAAANAPFAAVGPLLLKGSHCDSTSPRCPVLGLECFKVLPGGPVNSPNLGPFPPVLSSLIASAGLAKCADGVLLR